MNQINWRSSLAVSALLLALPALAQDTLRGTLTMGMGDVTAIKQKAEAGDAAAQVALGSALASRFHATEALDWYRKTAAQGNVEGKYHVGAMLLFGAPGIPQNLTVRPNQTEGIRWTFMAATNFHPHACRNMGKALRQGLGTSTNLVAAYAWLSLFANITPGSNAGRGQMNELALQLDTAALRQAQSLAAQFKAGNWQAPPTRAANNNGGRFTSEAFQVTVERREAICPAGHQNTQCSRLEEQATGRVSYRFEWDTATCAACALRQAEAPSLAWRTRWELNP